MVLPEQIGNAFTQQALNMGWHLRLRTDVAETEARLPHRVLLAFSPQAGECFSDRLVIRGPDQRYSEGYTALTRILSVYVMAKRRKNRRAGFRQLLWIIQRVVQAPALFTHHCAAHNQLGNLHQIAQLQ